MAYKKSKPPLQPRECSNCKKLFVPAEFKHKLCSLDCARSKWDAAVSRVKERTATSESDDLDGDTGKVPF
jgi:hypothetical protein